MQPAPFPRKSKSIPIIFITALTDEESLEEPLGRGNDYITKPFKRLELLTRVGHQLELLDKARELEHKNRMMVNVGINESTTAFLHGLGNLLASLSVAISVLERTVTRKI